MIKSPLTKLLKRGLGRFSSVVKKTAGSVSGSSVMPRRFLSDNPMAYRQALEAAESYVAKLDECGSSDWLYSKPFDMTPGNPGYFRLMYELMNLLKVMGIPVRGRILEIGSGPGWVTEILLMLGFSVDALEPSADLIKVAKSRCSALKGHYRFSAEPDVLQLNRLSLATIPLMPYCILMFCTMLCTRMLPWKKVSVFCVREDI